MQLDTKKKGLEAIFKPWQGPIVMELFERELISAEAHKFCVEHNLGATGKGEERPISRASVINFLNSLVDLRILDYYEETAKGGLRRIYKMNLTREEFAHKIIGLFVSTLREAFPEESISFPWLKV